VEVLLAPSTLGKGCSHPFVLQLHLFTGDLQNSTVKAEVQDPVTKTGYREPQSRPLTPEDRISTSKYGQGPFPSPSLTRSPGFGVLAMEQA
jgi:hypothetical protein